MSTLFSEGYFVLFLIITIGIVIGNIRIKGFSLDLSAVIFVALLLGHFGFRVPEVFQTIGLLFFIFTIGIQAGPGIFDAFQKNGRQLLVVCTLLVGTAASLSFGLTRLFSIDINMGVGIFNGALTSTPGLAAAIDATGSPLASIGYGLAYPLGVIGVVLLVHFLPVLFKADLKQEEKAYQEEIAEHFPEVVNRNFVVENKNVHGKTIRELEIGSMTQAIVSRVKHEDKASTPAEDTRLFLGDVVKVVGTSASLEKVEVLIGPPTTEEIPLAEGYTVNWVLITNKEVVGKSLRSLNLTAYYNATITRIRRSGIDLSPKSSSTLRFGDKVLLACNSEDMSKAMKLLGNNEKRLSETNFLPISLGIIIGLIVGKISIPFFGLFEFSPGITGGVLAAALVLSKLGKTGPIIWSMSGSANHLMRKLGLLMFLASVGTQAGAHMVEAFSAYGWMLLLIGLAITVLPVVVSALVGRYVLQMNMITLLGVIAGSMTSTPGLAAADAKTGSEAAAIGYATVYPLALVLMIIFSQILGKLG
jgi:putative transport protein